MDLEDGWPEDAVITRHSGYINKHIDFVRWIEREERERERESRGKEEKEKR